MGKDMNFVVNIFSLKSSTILGNDGVGEQDVEPKKKRSPSPYNIHMREEIARLKKAVPTISHQEAFRAAAKNWSKAKNKGEGGEGGH